MSHLLVNEFYTHIHNQNMRPKTTKSHFTNTWGYEGESGYESPANPGEAPSLVGQEEGLPLSPSVEHFTTHVLHFLWLQCSFVSATLEKTYPHSLQSKRLVLVCLSICFLRQVFIEKLALHAMQLNHLSPGCVCTCSFKWPFVKNHSFQLIQLNGFSPVSVQICVFKFMKIQHHFLVV